MNFITSVLFSSMHFSASLVFENCMNATPRLLRFSFFRTVTLQFEIQRKKLMYRDDCLTFKLLVLIYLAYFTILPYLQNILCMSLLVSENGRFDT